MSTPSATPRILVILAAAGLALFFLFGVESDSDYDPSLAGEFGVPRPQTPGDATGDPSLYAGGREKPDPKALEAARREREREAREALKGDGIYGVVMDGKARPIAGATVSLHPDPIVNRYRYQVPDGPAMATAITLEDGTFVVGPLPADGRAKLRGEASGYAATVQAVRARGGRVDLILDLGGTFKARVLDAEGKEVAEATVLHQAGNVLTEGTTNAEGVANFANLPTGTGNLLIYKRGHAAIRDTDVSVAPGETDQRTYVLAAATKLQGKVQLAEDARPVAGASVYLDYPQLPGLGKSPVTTTDDQGAFELLLEAGGQEQFVIHATKDGYAEGRSWLNAAHRGEVLVQLNSVTEAAEGRVTAAQGGPAVGAEVTYAFMGNEDNLPSVRTDASGRFTLPPVPFATEGTTWTLVATGTDGSVGTAQFQVPKKDAGRPAPIEIRLNPVGAVRGKVTGQAGEPMPGALVELQPDWSGGGRPMQPNDWMLLRLVQDQTAGSLSTVTDTEGKFSMTAVPALAYKISAQWGLQRALREDAIHVQQGGELEVDIALGEAGTIEGYVVDTEEKPIAGAYVYANLEQQGNQGWWGGNIYARSQSDGRFVLRGVAYGSRYTLYANASGYSGANQKGAQQGDKDQTLRLIRRGWIEGTVHENGTPYRGTFTVQAMAKQADEKSSRMNWMGGQQANTFNTDDGKFTLKGLNAGDYTLQASTPDGLIAVQREVVRVMDGRPSTPARLDLVRGARVHGRITQSRNGEPLASAWVYFNPKDGQGGMPSYGHADAQGRYEVKGLSGGSYLVTIWSPSGSNWSLSLDLDAGSVKELDLSEQEPGSVIVTAMDENEQPVGGARVHIRSDSGQYVGVNVQALQKDGLIGENYNWQDLHNTNEAGMLTRWHLPPGRHEVWVTKNGYDRAGDKVYIEIQSGMQTRATVQLKRK